MKKIDEYLQHAKECRDMARTAPPTHRVQLEQMTKTWEQLAAAIAAARNLRNGMTLILNTQTRIARAQSSEGLRRLIT